MASQTLQNWLQTLENLMAKCDVPAHERCREMLKRLGLQKVCPIVTVAGTNGKGSTTYFLAAYAEALGLKVGRFISPHLVDFNERIAINNQNATDNEIVAAFEMIKALQGDLYLGYVDYAFLAALLIFKEMGVNFIVLEVGLGGRLDATNSVDTDCAVITTIHFDHTQLLGRSREQIGFEKAGIFRHACPAICGDIDAPASIRAHAEAIGAVFYERGPDFDLIQESACSWSCKTRFQTLQNLPVPHFPLQNALTALFVIEILDQKQMLSFNEPILRKILQGLHVPGRMQRLASSPEIIVDVAHNPQSVEYLVQYLKMLPVKGRTFAVFSALRDKDLEEMVGCCKGSFYQWNILQLEHARAFQKEEIKEIISVCCANEDIHLFDSMDSLMESVLKQVKQEDRIIIFGSFYLVNLFLNWYNVNKKTHGFF